jgi:RecA-family ATPase
VQQRVMDSKSSYPRPEFLSYSELAILSKGRSWLVKGLIPSDGIGILFGPSRSYKSFTAIDCMSHIAHGKDWCGRKTKSGSVF